METKLTHRGEGSGDTRLRSRPIQARAQRTVERILSEAGDLLNERGWEGFNTNLLAERVGCRVATVYHYFPDKLAIVSRLAKMVVAEWGEEFAALRNELEPTDDLRLAWPVAVERFVAVLERNPHALAVRKAMQVVPELRSIDQEDNSELAANLGSFVQAQIPSIEMSRATSVARVLIESAVSVVDLAMSSTATESRCLRSELEAMHLAYIEQLYATEGQKA